MIDSVETEGGHLEEDAQVWRDLLPLILDWRDVIACNLLPLDTESGSMVSHTRSVSA